MEEEGAAAAAAAAAGSVVWVASQQLAVQVACAHRHAACCRRGAHGTPELGLACGGFPVRTLPARARAERRRLARRRRAVDVAAALPLLKEDAAAVLALQAAPPGRTTP